MRIPLPGSSTGPCLGECLHKDCNQLRNLAIGPCYVCGHPLGYDTDLCIFSERVPRIGSHRDCEEEKKDEG